MNSNELQQQPTAGTKDLSQRIGLSQVLSALTETFGLTRTASIGVVLFVSVVVVSAVVWFVESAPPRTLYITSGPDGSSFQRTAERYREILSSNGVTVKVLTSGGSMENLERLGESKVRVDLGFVQAGEAANAKSPLYSLGSIAYQPLLIFYRNPAEAKLLSDFIGKRLAIGPGGSGTRALALVLLATNGITPGGSTQLLDLDAANAAKGLLDGNVDAVFLMGDSASGQIMRSLLRAPGVQIFDFQQADAYTRKFGFLNKLQLPRGSIDFGKDMPSHDVTLIGPTVELVARAKLHPALCDLVLEAAKEVHGNATLLQRRGEFPAPLEHDFKISPEASRYYKSGKSFLYRSLPFWIASIVNRVLVAFVPMMLVLIPALRLIPKVYKFRTQLRIYRWYRGLLRLERDLVGKLGEAKRQDLERRLEHIEKSVNQMKVPASFAGQFYGLKEHIGFVRGRLTRDAGG
jgi:TRAP transporter TAXI family solute receptor